ARAYERAADAMITTADRAARASLRLGVLYALPESALYDPAEARRILQRVRAIYPRTPHAHEAALLLAGLESSPSATLVDPVTSLPQEEPPPPSASGDELRAALDRERSRARQLDSRVDDLTSQAERLHEEIARLEAELAQLKAIDLAEPPH
ncbi:MAG: hypothetical protein ACRD0X_05750, partial [Thermoanaerobaculia bacterium]